MHIHYSKLVTMAMMIMIMPLKCFSPFSFSPSSSAAATADVTLTISDIREVNGTRFVDVYMANTAEVRGFQFRVIQPDGSRLPIAAAGGGLAGKHGFQITTSPVTGRLSACIGLECSLVRPLDLYSMFVI